MAGHTPGTWYCEFDPRHEQEPFTIYTEAGIGGVIATVFYLPRPEAVDNPAEVDANALLLTAAPRMATLLDDAPRPSVQGNYGEFLGRYQAWLDEVRDVLASLAPSPDAGRGGAGTKEG